MSGRPIDPGELALKRASEGRDYAERHSLTDRSDLDTDNEQKTDNDNEENEDHG